MSSPDILPHERQAIRELDLILFPPSHPYDHHLEDYEWHDFFEESRSMTFIVEGKEQPNIMRKEVVAAALVQPKEQQTLYLFWIGVHPNHWHQGIGRYLLDHVVTYAKANGYHAIELDVNVNNIPTIKWYLRMGFTMKMCNRNYYLPDAERDIKPNVNYDGYTMTMSLVD